MNGNGSQTDWKDDASCVNGIIIYATAQIWWKMIWQYTAVCLYWFRQWLDYKQNSNMESNSCQWACCYRIKITYWRAKRSVFTEKLVLIFWTAPPTFGDCDTKIFFIKLHLFSARRTVHNSILKFLLVKSKEKKVCFFFTICAVSEHMAALPERLLRTLWHLFPSTLPTRMVHACLHVHGEWDRLSHRGAIGPHTQTHCPPVLVRSPGRWATWWPGKYKSDPSSCECELQKGRMGSPSSCVCDDLHLSLASDDTNVCWRPTADRNNSRETEQMVSILLHLLPLIILFL